MANVGWFWSEDWWLPGNTTWVDLENSADSAEYFPQLRDLQWHTMFCCVAMFVARFLVLEP